MTTKEFLASIFFIALICLTARARGGEDFVGGAENAAIIAAPDSVMAWRTVGSLLTTNHPAWHEQYFQKSGDGIPVSTNLASQLGGVLLDTNTYLPGSSTGCMARPGVAISFSKGKRTIDLYFCFECGILSIDSAPDPKKWLSPTNQANSFRLAAKVRTNGLSEDPNLPPKYIRAPPDQGSPETIGSSLFGPGRAEILAVIKKIFPTDPRIQSL